ncbi:23S rRNA (guanosine(2251)-2'-O)-methyltransferase RlmB [Isoalcanivorax indicus]|uniref:23S rRNA (guanosine(2251)-2'-O)-methyltransferase RlmB n=1 Tax=Isoalcanivorax indicus TaxID=2202653 RepID=UPI000DB912F3|nr:23S rRNA (guanosine(2251)-2'-O)-methyltransferase RlmB [Isoalcanivorax indicus]
MSKPLWFSGLHAVAAILRHRPEAVLEMYVLESRAERGEDRLERLCVQARRQGVSPRAVGRDALERHAGPQHQGVAVRARPRTPGDDNSLPAHLERLTRPPLLLVLDGVTDPHNLGACLRTADAVGVDGVIVPRRNACGLTPVACRSAAGAAESVAYFEVNNLARTLDALRADGVWVVGTGRDSGSQRLHDFVPEGPLAVVMGAEGDGMRRLTRDKCDYLLEIPMCGEVESLNVSVASAVVLYHLAAPRLSS